MCLFNSRSRPCRDTGNQTAVIKIYTLHFRSEKAIAPLSIEALPEKVNLARRCARMPANIPRRAKNILQGSASAPRLASEWAYSHVLPASSKLPLPQ
jgi:hypothetical protein